MRPRTFPRKKKPRERRSTPLSRKVHIDGEEWRWEHGNTLKILAPDQRYWSVSWQDFYGPERYAKIDWWCICDDCISARNFGPGDVKRYIEENILGRMAA